MRRRSFTAALVSLSLIPKATGAGVPHFRHLLAASLPEGIALPPAFEQAIDWLEAAGYVFEDSYAALTPPDTSRSIALQFEPVSQGHVAAWLDTDDPVHTNRLAPIIRTGGDGSYAALWRADDGTLPIVHMGSGSGSIMMQTLVENPVDMLRLMAIGYSELCWPENFAITPAEEHAALVAAIGIENAPVYRAPIEFRRFVEKTFDVSVPPRAIDIAGNVTPMDDPFQRWLQTVQEG